MHIQQKLRGWVLVHLQEDHCTVPWHDKSATGVYWQDDDFVITIPLIQVVCRNASFQAEQ